MTRTLKRRALLCGAGAAMSLPFLEAMLPRGRSAAQDREIPKRVVFFFSSNGVIRDQWAPSGEGSTFELGSSLASLERHRERLLILRGVDMASANEVRGEGGNGHDVGMGHALTSMPIVQGPGGVGDFGHLVDGAASGPSFDQVLGDVHGVGTRVPTLVLGAKHRPSDVRPLTTFLSYREPRDPSADRRARAVAPIADPARAFDTLFGDGAPIGDPAREREAAQRAFLAERSLADYERLRPRLSAEDRGRLDEHVEQLRALRERIAGGGAVSTCEAPTRRVEGDFGGTVDIQTDLAVAAMRCDLSRVVLLQWSTGQSGERFPAVGVDDAHHGISHHRGNAAMISDQRDIDRWYGDRFATLLDRLAAAPAEDGGSLLDHTVVLWMHEQSDGDRHTKSDMPYLIAAGAQTAIRTNRYVRHSGASHSELLVGIAHAIGRTEITRFGHPDVFDGPLGGLT
ncbi:MAG: DUF1552 domain-containing protein [Myxococcota bacterium]|nr:DUF1552 domain-containing protein [Myxococcota bacterium]